MLNCIKNLSQINENGAQEHSESDLGKSPIPGLSNGAGAGVFVEPFGITWAILGAFRGQLGAKGLPKLSLLAPSRQKVEKIEVQERVLKKH